MARTYKDTPAQLLKVKHTIILSAVPEKKVFFVFFVFFLSPYFIFDDKPQHCFHCRPYKRKKAQRESALKLHLQDNH